MRVVMAALTTGSNPKALVHGDKCHEANHDGNSEQKVLVRLDHYELDLVMLVLAQENLGE